MRILMAEDDANIIVIAKVALEKIGGHSIETVSDGAAALEKIMSETYDVVLLDEMMPKMNGREVFARYKESGKENNKVIFMSANNRNLTTEPLVYPEIGYISKPFDPMKLSQQIEEILNNANQEAV